MTDSAFTVPRLRVIDDISEIDQGRWEEYLSNHPQGNIFQSPDMVRLYASIPEYEPVNLFCVDDRDRIHGILVGYITRDRTRFLSTLSSRAIIAGGPLADRNDFALLSILISELKQRTAKKVTYIQFRNLFNMTDYIDCFSENGFTYEDHLDILINLKKSEEQLLRELHPSRRKQINRAIRRDVEVVADENPDDQTLISCYRILSKVYHKIGLPLPSFEFFHKAFEILGKKGRVKAFLALHKEVLIGFRFVLIYKDIIYDWFAGSSAEYYDKYPNDLLPWSIIIWGKNNGFKTFDFGGAGHPGKRYGVRDYKMKFGGELVNFGRHLSICKPTVYYSAKYYLKFRNIIKRSESTV
jgi:lipid II:glycine glycyltransferase (peptidoglycan interpeptide bridge formation enzyme)